MNEWEENYGLTAFMRKLATPQPDSDMRDWEVNTPAYKSKPVEKRMEELFLDKEPILSAFVKKVAEEGTAFVEDRMMLEKMAARMLGTKPSRELRETTKPEESFTESLFKKPSIKEKYEEKLKKLKNRRNPEIEKQAKLFSKKKKPGEFDDLMKQRDSAIEALRANTNRIDELNPKASVSQVIPKPTPVKNVSNQLPAVTKNKPTIIDVKPSALKPKMSKGKLALIGAGVGAVGLGAKKLYDDHKEKTAFIEDRMRLEKLAASYTRDGVEYGVTIDKDKNGYFAKTHRARSKSYDTAEQIPVKDLKFIDSTG